MVIYGLYIYEWSVRIKVLDGVLVYEARSKMGEKLAKKIFSLQLQDEIDIVIPIPETSRTAALACASILQRPYREGFIKNRYIARTFIMPVCGVAALVG